MEIRDIAAFLATAILLTSGCGDSAARNVDIVLAGGDGVAEARMELLFAKAEALGGIIAALSDTSQPAAGRAELVDILWKLHLRESDPRILPSLIDRIEDPAPEVRAAVAISLMDMGAVAALPRLLAQLSVETDDEARHQQLKAIEAIDDWRLDITSNDGTLFVIRGGDNLLEPQRQNLVIALRDVVAHGSKDSLRNLADEILSKMAGQLAAEGDRLLLAADLAGSEKAYREALDLLPTSAMARQRLGQLFVFNGDRERGLRILAEWGLTADVHRLSSLPILDGELSDEAWKTATRLEPFDLSTHQVRVIDATAPSVAWVGYTDTSLWVAVQGFEESTSDLTAEVTERDGGVWRDDCVEVLLDADLDRNTFHQLIVNSIGTQGDYLYGSGPYTDGILWNGTQRAAARVDSNFWSMEMEIPISMLAIDSIHVGDLWGLNIARVRISHGGEYNTWIPTYGNGRRPDRFGLIRFQ